MKKKKAKTHTHIQTTNKKKWHKMEQQWKICRQLTDDWWRWWSWSTTVTVVASSLTARIWVGALCECTDDALWTGGIAWMMNQRMWFSELSVAVVFVVNGVLLICNLEFKFSFFCFSFSLINEHYHSFGLSILMIFFENSAIDLLWS